MSPLLPHWELWFSIRRIAELDVFLENPDHKSMRVKFVQASKPPKPPEL
jgi:hypothetical protein